MGLELLAKRFFEQFHAAIAVRVQNSFRHAQRSAALVLNKSLGNCVVFVFLFGRARQICHRWLDPCLAASTPRWLFESQF